MTSTSARMLEINVNPNLITHNERVFKYSQAARQISRVNYTVDENYLYSRRILTLNTKRGLKQKSLMIFSNSLQYVYGYFDRFETSLAQEYPNYTTFFEFSRTFADEFYKPDFLLKYIYMLLELVFIIKKVKPKKKLKKKKIVPKVLISYVSRTVRPKITTRVINAYLVNFDLRNVVSRFGNALMYLALSGKQSYLYKKKTIMYTRLLEKKKFF